MRIHDDDCDVEPLDEQDFEERGVLNKGRSRLDNLAVRHSIEISKLAVLSKGCHATLPFGKY